ncbi:MAG: C1 family peptidase [Chloroflexi bacterium]|nr:C1 family peptidase [Chloroflexota bacterium]
MAEKQGVPLSSITGFPEAARNRLAELWITTAEDLAGAAVQVNGVQGLSAHLGLTEAETIALVEQAQAALPPDVSFAPGDIDRRSLGSLDEPKDEEPDAGAVSFAVLPPKTDLRARMPPVRDQGGRGTCVAHACAAVREYLLGEQSPAGNLSEQYLYWDCKQRDGYAGAGTYISTAMTCLLEDGVCAEDVWPYNPEQVAGNEGQGPPPATASQEAAGRRISKTDKLKARGVDDIRQVLANNQPVAFAVPVYTFWFAEPGRSTGDLRMPLPTDHEEGGHAMCMVGYEDDPDVPGGGFFLVRNSWGTGWGFRNEAGPGHARIPYAYIENYASAAHTASVVSTQDTGDQTTDDWLRRLWRRWFT